MKGYYLGTGLLSVVGTSFATLSTANAVCHSVSALRFVLILWKIFNAMYANGTCSSTTASDGTITRNACPDAYGYVLGMFSCTLCISMLINNRSGTSLICSFLEIFMSFIPVRILQRIFPPMVTGTVILMIGASLVGSSGIPNWGGGSNDCMSRPTTGFFRLCPDITAPRPLP